MYTLQPDRLLCDCKLGWSKLGWRKPLGLRARAECGGKLGARAEKEIGDTGVTRKRSEPGKLISPSCAFNFSDHTMNSTRKPATLDSLPPEIVLEILGYLAPAALDLDAVELSTPGRSPPSNVPTSDRRALVAVCLVSRRFRNLGQPILFRSVDLKSPSQAWRWRNTPAGCYTEEVRISFDQSGKPQAGSHKLAYFFLGCNFGNGASRRAKITKLWVRSCPSKELGMPLAGTGMLASQSVL